MIIIAIMDGAMGFSRRNNDRRAFMSDKVQLIAQNQSKERIINIERGSMFHWASDRMENFIRAHNVANNNLICIGKSQGAKNLANIINEINDKSALRYNHTSMISIDMNWGPFPTNKNNKVVNVSGIDYIYNIRQTGRLGGALIKCGKIINTHTIEGSESDHWNIEYNNRWFGEFAFLLSK